MRTLSAVKSLQVLNIKQPSVSPMAVFLVPICLLFVFGLSGCAGKEGVAWQDDKDFVFKSLGDMSETQKQLSQTSALFDKRILALEKKAMKQQANIDALIASVKAQKNKKHDTAMPKKRSFSKKKTTKKKLTKKETLTTKIDQIDSDIKQAVIQSKADYKPAEKNDYTAAYLALKSGRYDEAIGLFKTFLNVYPSGEYADQAYYWLGESLLAKGEPLPATKAFNTLTKTYPKSSKYQAGLLKLGIAYQQAQRLGDAKAVLQQLIDEYPDSKAAENARSRLSALKINKK
ncbi:MAG: tol-pal system protein YbgF [Mariprofundaceae bacterium]|nr:tol-pal system protein YbgF [Mariprofundaceae bacterium]